MNTNKHVNFFAPVFICLAFGLAIVTLFPLIFQSGGIKRNIGYEGCAKMAGSRIQETYPPICVTADGRGYTKNLPKIKMPAGQ